MSELKQFPAEFTAAIDKICARAKVLPVIVVNQIEDAVPLAKALVAGGLPNLEVTLRTDCALDAIRAMKDVEGATVGAGTVLTVEQYKQAEEAGAEFIVTPGATSELFEYSVNAEAPMLPGVATISELMEGMRYGLRRFKFFPAESSGGASAVKSFGGPIQGVKFCPTGGITLEKAPTYLKLSNIMCVGGSWVLPQNLIDAKDWDGITKLCRETVEALKDC